MKFSDLYLKRSFHQLLFQTDSYPDSTTLAQQVQALAATIEELTKHNQEMKLQLQQVQQAQQESKGNPDEEGVAIGGVLTEDLLPRMNRIQICCEK